MSADTVRVVLDWDSGPFPCFYEPKDKTKGQLVPRAAWRRWAAAEREYYEALEALCPPVGVQDDE